MSLYFITGNKNKFKEIKKIIPEIKQFSIDLPEIQEIDPKKVIQAKLLEASKYKTGSFIVEDTSLFLDCLNGLPGPLIKWFMKTIGNNGLFELSNKLNSNKAVAKTFIGYTKDSHKIHYFEGILKGIIVSPKGKNGFGWDRIFQPKNYSKTLAEISLMEKNKISMRKIALEKLKVFLKHKQSKN